MSLFLAPSDPLLKTHVAEVPVHEITQPHIQVLIDQMYEVAKGERVDPSKRSMIGLAAPQIGIFKRIILVDTGTNSERSVFGELKAFINPQILWNSEELLWDREGCFSVDSRIGGIVPRFESIKLIAYDRFGNPIAEKVHGFTARIFQHEIDHLDGIRFPDRVGKEGDLHWVETHEFADYRKNWQNWKVRCEWDTWMHMKEGSAKHEPPSFETDVHAPLE